MEWVGKNTLDKEGYGNVLY